MANFFVIFFFLPAQWAGVDIYSWLDGLPVGTRISLHLYFITRRSSLLASKSSKGVHSTEVWHRHTYIHTHIINLIPRSANAQRKREALSPHPPW